MNGTPSPSRAVCVRCAHFRPARPISQLLARALPSTAGPVADALGKIGEDEQKVRDTEAEFKRQQATTRKTDWPMRPTMSDACGALEADDRWQICEVKNVGGDCPDFDPAPPPPHRCEDCRHRVDPLGPTQDAQRERVYLDLMRVNISAGVKQDSNDRELDQYRRGVTGRQALELGAVYASQGMLLDPPRYLAHCASRSGPQGYAVCAVHNRHQCCPQWQPTEETTMTSSYPPAADLGSPPPGPPPVFGASQPVNAAQSGTGARMSDQEVAEFAAAVVWLLGLPSDPQLLARIGTDITATLATGGGIPASDLQSFFTLYREATSQGPDAAEMVREQVQPEVVAGLRKEPDAVSQLLVRLYDEANPPLAPGEPPLTREVSDAYLGILSFVDALMENRPWTPLPQQAKDTFAGQVATGYPALSPAQQTWLAGMPLAWATTRTLWGRASEEQRRELAAQLVASYGQTAASTPLLAEPVPAPPMPPVFGGTAPATGTTFREATATTDELLAQIHAEQRKKEAELEATDPEQAVQLKLQHQLVNATMMSNMLTMQHQASMAIVNNFKA